MVVMNGNDVPTCGGFVSNGDQMLERGVTCYEVKKERITNKSKCWEKKKIKAKNKNIHIIHFFVKR